MQIALVELIMIAGTLARFSNLQKVSLELSMVVYSLKGRKFLPFKRTLVPPASGPLSGMSSVMAGQE
jgi:hypothetical protein